MKRPPAELGAKIMEHVEEFGAASYEAGFAAGERHEREQRVVTVEAVAETAVPAEKLRDLYERLMFYRAYFSDATDKSGEPTRAHAYLSDITRDFGALVDQLP